MGDDAPGHEWPGHNRGGLKVAACGTCIIGTGGIRCRSGVARNGAGQGSRGVMAPAAGTERPLPDMPLGMRRDRRGGNRRISGGRAYRRNRCGVRRARGGAWHGRSPARRRSAHGDASGPAPSFEKIRIESSTVSRMVAGDVKRPARQGGVSLTCHAWTRAIVPCGAPMASATQRYPSEPKVIPFGGAARIEEGTAGDRQRPQERAKEAGDPDQARQA
jgi:hypothetical protein